MISASEPFEFVPHGRTVLDKHPGKIYSKGHNNTWSENSLLYKLTNFDIKDDSFIEGNNFDVQEFWTIREVASGNNGLEDLLQSEVGEEYLSDNGSRPQSHLKNDYNISIKSEIHGGRSSRGGSSSGSSGLSAPPPAPPAPPAPAPAPTPAPPACSYEEELYVKGCTAVWSKGLISSPGSRLLAPETRKTIACYTIDNPIQHAAFCNFHVSINNAMLIDALNSQIGDKMKHIKIEDTTEHIPKEIMPSILLIDNKCMRVYAADGREYFTSIPFAVKRVWPMKYGVVLEKEGAHLLHQTRLKTSLMKLNESRNSSFSRSRSLLNFSSRSKLEAADVALPTCFSLGHPLDEVTPVLIKPPAQPAQYYNDTDLQILFVSSEPSIVLTYDWKSLTHSLWTVRRARRDECLAACPNANSTSANLSQSVSDFPGTLMHSHARNTSTPNLTRSFAHSKKGTATPTKNQSRAASLANVLREQGLTPDASGGASRLGLSASARLGCSGAAPPAAPPALPMYPDVCLDHVWTEAGGARRDPADEPAEARAFLHTDLVGNDYLCYMVRFSGASRLQVVRLQRSHAAGVAPRTRLVAGAASSLPARDAAPLPRLNMIALIDEAGNILLHSGTFIVGKVHVGGVLARLLDSPYARPAAARRSPFPRRSSLLPSRAGDAAAAALDDSAFHMLSPVPHAARRPPAAGLTALRDPAGSCVTLRYDGSAMYRITLPPLAAAPLVGRCCAALRQALPRDVALEVLVKWYGVRNAPGSADLGPEEEWGMFVALLGALAGGAGPARDTAEPPELASKKQRVSGDGSNDDWDYLLASRMHKTYGESLAHVLQLRPAGAGAGAGAGARRAAPEPPAEAGAGALLVPYCAPLLFALHLLYEDLKLNTLLLAELPALAQLLGQLARQLRLPLYQQHYWLDAPPPPPPAAAPAAPAPRPPYFTPQPPCLFSYLHSLCGPAPPRDPATYPYLAGVNNLSRDIIEVACLVGGRGGAGGGVHAVSARDAPATSTPDARAPAPAAALEPHCRAVQLLYERGWRRRDVEQLPAAAALLVARAQAGARAAPPPAWPRGCLELALRADLAAAPDVEWRARETPHTGAGGGLCAARDERGAAVRLGMEHLDTRLARLLHPRDNRLVEVVGSLQCSLPASVPLVQMAEVSDHDFADDQQKHVFAHATRTMSLPLARGMVTLRTLPCEPTEPVLLPKLVVSGRGPKPRYMHIDLNSAGGAGGEPAHCLAWPNFHNGCAAGLAVAPPPHQPLDASWIIFNKPKGATDMSAEHAGFLLGLGLNGHLRRLPFIHVYDYLLRGHEMLSVGVLLGLAATYRGTMNIQALKVMSIHLEPLLPPTSIELDIQQNILDAALLGVGLIFQGTRHMHYAHVLLGEIGKPPGPEMENCTEREGYALAAGLALGMVLVGAGGDAPPYVAQALRTYMLGGDKQPLPNRYKEKYKQGSFAIREGSLVNLDVTAPGATLALGLIYLRSDSAVVSAWLDPPPTPYMLDFVRPDLLMLRCIAKGLINWQSVSPEPEWVEAQVPDAVRPYCFIKPLDDVVDYEAMNQTYCNVVAGACFALGLRFAGSGDEDAKDTILHYIKLFIALSGKSVGELAGRSTLETCLSVCLLAAGMVLAGRGDLALLRVCRRLRARLAVPPAPPRRPPLSHGGQLAVHMTLGLLFLGGGRLTLGSSPAAVAALLAAFFPKFPVHSEDNRYHLQAFRHLYALAVEPRLVVPRALSSGALCYARLRVLELAGDAWRELRAPCLLPALAGLTELRVDDPRYWPVVFRRGQNWDLLEQLLAEGRCLDLQERSPQPTALLGGTLTPAGGQAWGARGGGGDARTLQLLRCCAGPRRRPPCRACRAAACRCRRGAPLLPQLSVAAHECLLRDAAATLPLWLALLQMPAALATAPAAYEAWQARLLAAQLGAAGAAAGSQPDPAIALIPYEFATSILQKVEETLERGEARVAPLVRAWLGGAGAGAGGGDARRLLAAYVTYYELSRGCAPAPAGPLAAAAAAPPRALDRLLALL